MRKCSYANGAPAAGIPMLWRVAAVAVLGLALFLVHRPPLHAPFYLDSTYHLAEKSNLHMEAPTPDALWRAIHLDTDSPRIYRPLSGLTLAFTYWRAGLDPAAYRLGNIAIHILASLSLLFLLTAVLRAPRVARRYPVEPSATWLIALLATTIWSLHPVQTNVVSYVIQRMTSLSGLFSFLAVGAYVRLRSGRGWAWAPLVVAATLCSAASKEIGALAPCFFLLAEWLLLDPPAQGAPRKALASAWGAILAGAAIVALLQGPALWHKVQAGYAVRSFTMGERLLTEATIQLRYLTLLFVPDPRLLTIDAEVSPSKGLLHPPETLGGVLLILLTLALAVLWARRRPLVSLAIAWFFVAQAVESTILPLELYFEHRLYVPAALLYVPVAHGVFSVARRHRWAAVAGTATLACVLGAEAWATHYRATLWAD
ncbi:MAG: hypothetical protein HY900_36340, partial [Deltaproteobacteria bacterium]|nr:hypothetical protein [Deltaproteobacteria bacterium]